MCSIRGFNINTTGRSMLHAGNYEHILIPPNLQFINILRLQSTSWDKAEHSARPRRLDPTIAIKIYSFVLYLQHVCHDITCKPSMQIFNNSIRCPENAIYFILFILQICRSIFYAKSAKISIPVSGTKCS